MSGVYAWIEFVIWLVIVIVAVAVFGIRYHHYQVQNNIKAIKFLWRMLTGLLLVLLLNFLGVQIGHVKKFRLFLLMYT